MRTTDMHVIALAAVALGLSACGVNRNHGGALIDPSHPAAIVVTNSEAQREIVSVMEEVHLAIAEAADPSLKTELRGITATSARALTLGKCEADVQIRLIGVDLAFDAVNGCRLDGTVGVRLFPTTAQVDLDVVGLNHVRAISFDADLVLNKQNQGIDLAVEFLGGSLSLSPGKLLPLNNLALSGRGALRLGGGVFGLSARTNAFDANTGVGAAFILDIQRDRNSGASTSDIRGCFLSGGSANDPDAGTLTACFNLGKKG